MEDRDGPGMQRHAPRGAGADVLLLTASLGRGHRTAALALSEALLACRPGLRLATTDEAEILGPAVYRLVRDLYGLSLRHWRSGFEWFYATTARLAPGSWLHRHVHGLGQGRLLRILRRCRPQVVVCTFAEQAGTLSELRRRGLWRGAAVAVLTDHAAHSQWVYPGFDLYCAPSTEVAAALVRLGCAADRVVVTGIPVRSGFEVAADPESIRRELGLDPALPTVVVTPGAFDEAESVVAACRTISALPWPVQVLAVAGNRRAQRRVAVAVRGWPRIRVLGFVRNMARLLSAGDLLVGKAGGVTTSEACCCGLAMVLAPAPGQERHNAQRLAQHGAAVIVGDGAASLPAQLERILGDRATLEAMRAASLRLAAPDAAAAAARRIVDLLEAQAAAGRPDRAPAAEAPGALLDRRAEEGIRAGRSRLRGSLLR